MSPFYIGPFRQLRRRLPDIPSLTDPIWHEPDEPDEPELTLPAHDPVWHEVDDENLIGVHAPFRAAGPNPHEEKGYILRRAASEIHCHPSDYPHLVRLVASGCIEALMEIHRLELQAEAFEEQLERLRAENDVLAERLMTSGLRVQELERRLK